MILVDTSVWVEHFRNQSDELSNLLEKTSVLSHPFVIGELACGNIKNRPEILSLLFELPAATAAENREVFELVESKKLMGQGIGWIDCHLLASALLSGAPLWTSDRKLRTVSAALGVLY